MSLTHNETTNYTFTKYNMIRPHGAKATRIKTAANVKNYNDSKFWKFHFREGREVNLKEYSRNGEIQ